MRYEETINLIKEKADAIQKDIFENPLRYIKDNQIDKELIYSNLFHEVKKITATSWIDKSDLEEIIKKGRKIKLEVNKCRKNITYTLIDKKGNKLVINNDITALYKSRDEELLISIIFPIEGSFLNFSYLFEDIQKSLLIKFDISNLMVVVKLITNNNIYSDSKFNFIKL
jgi:hypothetical protein